MNGLNKQFKANVRAFMSVNVICIQTGGSLDKAKPFVPGVGPPGRPDSGVYDFDLRATNSGYVELDLMDHRGAARSLHTDAISAYWLPWESNATAELTLGQAADFFFTSNVGGCRFQVKGRINPTVYHISGGFKGGQNSAPEWRDAESMAYAGNRKRTFSLTKHYHGSAFVAGYRDPATDRWSFLGQAITGSQGILRINRIQGFENGLMPI